MQQGHRSFKANVAYATTDCRTFFSQSAPKCAGARMKCVCHVFHAPGCMRPLGHKAVDPVRPGQFAGWGKDQTTFSEKQQDFQGPVISHGMGCAGITQCRHGVFKGAGKGCICMRASIALYRSHGCELSKAFKEGFEQSWCEADDVCLVVSPRWGFVDDVPMCGSGNEENLTRCELSFAMWRAQAFFARPYPADQIISDRDRANGVRHSCEDELGDGAWLGSHLVGGILFAWMRTSASHVRRSLHSMTKPFFVVIQVDEHVNSVNEWVWVMPLWDSR